MRKYKGIDIGRIVFACLIPLLHIGMTGSLVFCIRQYISRLGVPFFYAVAGMFLTQSMEKNGRTAALKRYATKIARILIIWLVIYLPILILRKEGMTLREMFFKTPAYLWYLTGLLVAAVPFCLIKNRKALLLISLGTYVFGTLFGETYSWLIGGLPGYEAIFITTRNGIFFGLPMMCIGEATWKAEKTSLFEILLCGGGLLAEITLVCQHSDPGSMYLALPGFIYFLVVAFRNWNPDVNTKYFGGISSAIYLMQFGVITVVMKAAEIANLTGSWIYWLAYVMVIVIPTAFYVLFREKRLVYILF